MYSIRDYGAMIADRGRTEPYCEALKSVVNEDSVVLDIGTGTGFFALLACQFGARHVYAIEPNDAIQVARELAGANGFFERVTFIQELSTSVDLPEKANVIISDMRGRLPLNGHHLPAIIDARRRHLEPSGTLIPSGDFMRAALVEAPDLYQLHLSPWNGNESGLDIQATTRWIRNTTWSDGVNADDERIVGESKTWQTLDYHTLESPNVAGEMTWHLEQSAAVHGIRVWFDKVLTDGVGFSNTPDQPELIYGSLFFPWTKPVALETGDVVTISIRANLVGAEYVWRWNTGISAQDPGKSKVEYKQSTFEGIPISLAQLRKTAADHKPVLNEDGLLNLEIMQMMEQGLLLEGIANEIVARFPDRFADWQQALAYVWRAFDQVQQIAAKIPNEERMPLVRRQLVEHLPERKGAGLKTSPAEPE